MRHRCTVTLESGMGGGGDSSRIPFYFHTLLSDIIKVTVNSSLALLSTMTLRRMGEWRYSSSILDLGLDIGKWSASRPYSFTPGKSRRYPMARRRGGPQGQHGRNGEEKNLLPLQRIEARFLGRPARTLVVTQTESSWPPLSVIIHIKL
jgi:hypothetical protein